jgi:hypothetical protein
MKAKSWTLPAFVSHERRTTVTEYTATFVRALIEGLEPLKVDAPSEEALADAVESLEGLEGLIERRAGISGVAIESGRALWVPVARNCRLSVGVAVGGNGLLSFAVGDESAGGALTTHFSARTAAAHALHSAKYRVGRPSRKRSHSTPTVFRRTSGTGP